MNILVVEDSQVTLNLLSNRLKEWGHTLYSAKNGVDAWERLKSVSVDIVVSDWIIPELDGLELCRRIRSADFKRYIYIILTTPVTLKKRSWKVLRQALTITSPNRSTWRS
jgi:CheY-like chemotaxis protein